MSHIFNVSAITGALSWTLTLILQLETQYQFVVFWECNFLQKNHMYVLPMWCVFFFLFFVFFFVLYLGLLSWPFTIHRTAGEGGGYMSLTLLYQCHPFHRHWDTTRATTAESSLLHIGKHRTRTGSLWFSSTNR